MVKELLSVLDKSYDLIEYVTDRKGHDLRYAIDSSKVCKQLSWEAKITLKEGFDKMKILCSV